MTTARCQYEQKGCYIRSEFGQSYAKKVFGLDDAGLEALVGRYTRGKHKGELRGWIGWFKTTKGGWVKTGQYDWDNMQGTGFVAKAGLTFGHYIEANGRIVAGCDIQIPRSNRAPDPVLEALKERCRPQRKEEVAVLEAARAKEDEDIYADLWEDMDDETLTARYVKQALRLKALHDSIKTITMSDQEQADIQAKVQSTLKVMLS